jgi:hypothetical protein
MSTVFLNSIANYSATQVTHIGLLNAATAELSSLYYGRKAVTWATAADGVIRPTANLDFTLVPGDEVRYWAAYGASTGGVPLLPTLVPLFTPATLYIYRLQAASTGIAFSVTGG